MNHWLHPAAENEFAEAVDFYLKRAGAIIARGYAAEVARALNRMVVRSGHGNWCDMQNNKETVSTR